MIAIFTPLPSNPSSFCATSAPIIGLEYASSGFPCDTGSGPIDNGCTENTASATGIECSGPTCERGTLTDRPFQSALNEYRWMYVTPAAAAFDLNASCSDFSVAALVPLTAGGLLSSTNHAVGVSFP